MKYEVSVYIEGNYRKPLRCWHGFRDRSSAERFVRVQEASEFVAKGRYRFEIMEIRPPPSHRRQ